jgi:hypothetical protein
VLEKLKQWIKKHPPARTKSEQMQLKNLIKQRLREGVWSARDTPEMFCIDRRITEADYAKLEAVAIKENLLRQEREERWVLAENLTPLEMRLFLGTPAYKFYGCAKRPTDMRPERIYPCKCLKRESRARFLKWHQKLHGAMAGWYAGIKCEFCRGSGIITTKEEHRCFIPLLTAEKAIQLVEADRQAQVA